MPISIDNIFGESTPSGKSTSPASSSKVSLDNIFASEPVSVPAVKTPVSVQSAVDSVKAPKVTTVKTPLIKDNSTLGIIKNTITGIPKAAWNFLGIGKVQDYLNTPEGQEAAANLSVKDVAKNIVPELTKFVATPIADVAGVFTGPKTYKIPSIFGDTEVTNIQKQTYDAVQAGENPYIAIVNAVPQSIFDGLMVAGITEKIFSPRENVIATGVKSNDLPSGTKPVSSVKSFRLSKPPEIKSNPVPNEAIVKLQESGVKLKNYNPANPTYFRTTKLGNGVIKGEIVQLKPSYFNLFKSKFGGDINSVPEEGTNTVYENSTTINELQNKMGEQTQAPKTEAVVPTQENLTNLANTIKQGKTVETGPTISLPKTAIANIASQFRPKVPSIEGVNKESTTKLTMEQAQPLATKAVDQYWKDKIQPSLDKGEATVIGADDMKDHFGKDYNENNHPVYSRAAFQTYEKALEANKNPNVILTGGGPASGKTDLIIEDVKNKGFTGTIYDSNMANYEGVVKQIDMAKNLGKNVEIHGILPNLDMARTYSIIRENETGRGINDATFARGHAGFPEVMQKLLENKIIDAKDVKILDTRNVKTFEEAIQKVFDQDYLSDPLATLKELGYNEATLKKIYGKENYNITTGQRKNPLPTSGESSKVPSENRANQGDAIRARDEGVLEQTKIPESRLNLPEVPTNLKRVTDYQARLKLRGADPVLVDAIITPTGQRAYGVSVGGTLTFEKVVQQFTEDHEIGHLIWQNFDKMRIFDGFYKKELLAEAKTLYGNDLTDLQLEEEIMSDYQQYVHDREANKQSTFFGKILEFFERLYAAMKRMFRTQRDINEFYRIMYEGKATEETFIKNEMPESFLEQQKSGVVDFKGMEFGGQKFNLDKNTKLTSADILKKHANIQLKRDIVITDVYGDKATLKAGEGITPYEVTGNKFILQDGEAFLVSKSQAENVINNSIKSEAKAFAPELKQTEETIKGSQNDNVADNSKLFELVKENDNFGYDSTGEAIKDLVNGNLSTSNLDTNNPYDKEIIRDILNRRSTPTKYSQYTLPGGENYKEILIKAPEFKKGTYKEMVAEYGNDWKSKIIDFKSSHWDEPNVISHIRLNDRKYNGKDVTFMEELQSDWAREARKDLPTRTIKQIGNKFAVLDENRNVISSFDTKEEAEGLLNNRNVPTNPLLKNWQELSIKRALQDAVANNSDYFAWINGPQTAARYNLSKEINSIEWSSNGETKQVNIMPKGAPVINLDVDKTGIITKTYGQAPAEWKGKSVAEAIGKGLGDKILTDDAGALKGEGLNVGGEWASNLYDRQVRTIVENLTGQKVEMLDMGLNIDKPQIKWAYVKPSIEGQYKPLTEDVLKVGLDINGGNEGDYIITKVLDNGKFEAIKTGQYAGIYIRDGKSFLNFKKEKPADYRYIMKNFAATKTFDISGKTTSQMGIEITPEVKQIINGEAPQVKVSGKLPFEDQAIAPPMFNLKPSKIDPLIEEARKYKTAEEFIKSIDNQGDKSFREPNVGLKTKTGEPIIMKGYHGTTKSFDKFTIPEKGVRYTGDGIYFYPSKNDAMSYISGKDNGRVVESYLDLKNPYNMYLPEGNIDWQPGKDLIDSIKSKGHDAIIVRIKDVDSVTKKVEADFINEIVVFDTNAIKTKSQLEEIWNQAHGLEPKFNVKLPKVETGNKLEDAKQILAHVEKTLGISSAVKSIKDQEAMIEVSKEVLDMSPMKDLEPYVADAGAYKGTLPEVTGKSIEEIKKNPDFKGVKNQKAIEFAKKGDSISQEIVSEYGMDIDSNEVRAEFENYQDQKERIVKQEQKLKQDKIEFGKTDTFQLRGKDASLIGEITATKETPESIKEIIDQVRIEKKARREEVLNHPARPLMKYVDRKTQKLPKLGSSTAFGKEGVQILEDLHFNDVKEAQKALEDYISKRNEFVNPTSRLALDERNAKFLRDKQKILEEVEKKIRAEARDRKQKIEAIRDFFYMTEGEMRDTIGDVDYRLLSDAKFEELLTKLEEKSLAIAEHAVAVSEVEWTIAQKELHRTENLQQVMGFPTDLKKMTTEQLNTLNESLDKFERGDVFLGVREIETLAKNAGLPDVKTQRQILEEVIGKRSKLPIEEIKQIVTNSFDEFRGAVSLARQNAFYDVLVSDAYQLKIEAALRYQEIENKTNELVKKARDSRKKSLAQRLAPTDDMVIAYLEEGDLEVKAKISKDMSNAEKELAHYIQGKYGEMRDFLVARQQLERIRENYYTHRPRGFLEAWLKNGVTKSPKQFVGAFTKAFKETIIDIHKLDEAAFKILDEQTDEILPLEKFFKYSMRRSGQLIPTKNLAKAFLGYAKTFETKRGLDQYMPRMEATARALTPTETTEGGVIKDTSLERFVKKWINTQKGRPISVGPIHPGDTLDSLLRTGVAFTRFLDLALRVPAQFMSLVGEESATFINIGAKQYALGQFRAKTKQGKAIAEKYEAFVGRTFWDKMKDQSVGIESKLGETLFSFYGIAARNANIHHLLGVLTPEEFKTGNITPERLTEIKKEMNRWRADDMLASVMGKTSVGGVFREHKSWAIPILNQTLSNLQDLGGMIKKGEFKNAAKSKEFGELFRATMLTLILVLTVSKIYQDLINKGGKRNLAEELQYRAINDAFSFISSLSPTTLFTTPRLMSFITDLSKNVSLIVQGLATGDRTATTGEVPGLKPAIKQFTPKLFSPLLTPSEQDKVMTSITTSTLAAEKKLDEINTDIVSPAKTAWEEVKKAGVGTEEADAIVSDLSDDQYEAYKLVKKADNDYWTGLTKKVTHIAEEAYKLGFGTPEADKVIEDLSDDEYTAYKTVKKNLYGEGEAAAQPTDWDKQTFIQHITNLAKGWSTDPVTAFDNLIHGDWKITQIKGGEIIVDRMPLDASQKIKTEAAKNNANYKLDHIIPITASGTNRPSNLNIITTEQWEENTPVEVYLGKALKNEKITGKEARELIIRFKAGAGQKLSPELQKEYETKYGGQPITFDEIKQEVSE